MFDSGDRPRADHDVGRARQNRGGQGGNIIGVILIVGVRVDDDVRSEAQTGVQPGHKPPR